MTIKNYARVIVCGWLAIVSITIGVQVGQRGYDNLDVAALALALTYFSTVLFVLNRGDE
jgi:hypothetical protein